MFYRQTVFNIPLDFDRGCGQPGKLHVVYKIILVGMVTIIMIMTTGKRKLVPATNNVHIRSGLRIIPALRKKGHIRFRP